MKNEIITSSISNVPIMISSSKNIVTTEKGRRICEAHYHDEVEFLYVFTGKLRLKTPDAEHIISEGEVVFISSRTVHETFHDDNRYCGAIIQFKVFDFIDDLGKNMTRFVNFDEVPVYVFKKEDELTAWLFKDEKEKRVYVYNESKKGTKTIITKYRVLKEKNDLSLAEVELVTGRTHQIRAHFASIKHALLGDGKYGNNKINKENNINRQALCAYKLIFDFKTDAGILSYLDKKEFEVKDVWFRDLCE